MDHIQSLARRFQNALQFSFFLLAQGTQGVFLWLSHGFAPFLSPFILPPSCLNHVSITSQSFHWQRGMQLRDGPLVAQFGDTAPNQVEANNAEKRDNK